MRLIYCITIKRKEAFRVKHISQRKLARRKDRIAKRLRPRRWRWRDQRRPMLAACNVRYEVADRARRRPASNDSRSLSRHWTSVRPNASPQRWICLPSKLMPQSILSARAPLSNDCVAASRPIRAAAFGDRSASAGRPQSRS
jgi:hypothetical protein